MSSVVAMLKEIITSIRRNRRRKRYCRGASISRFLAPDIQREVDEGYVTAKLRTWNVLYAIRGLQPKPDFSEPKRLELARLWEWKGARWGGPVPLEEEP